MKTIRRTFSIALVAVMALGVSDTAFAQKKKKKKKKKDKTEVVTEKKVILTDTSKICPTYTDKAVDPVELSKRFSYMALRRMAGDLEGAYDHWKYVYEKAPGFSSLVYSDGSAIHLDFAQQAKENGDTAKFDKYSQIALDLIDEGGECFENEEEFYGVKAYTFQTLWPNKHDEILEYYKKYMSYKGVKTDPHSLMELVRYATYMHQLGKIELDEVKRICAKTKQICNENKGNYQYDEWALPSILAMEKTFKEWLAAAETDSKVNTTRSAYQEMLELLEQGNLSAALVKYDEYINSATDADTKYRASLYVGSLFMDANRYPEARRIFQKAAAEKPGEGMPYYYIGTMYLSSGELCGPGTGFESQQVIWPAFDKFNKAVSLNMEPGLKADIQQTMSTYMQYLPKKTQLDKEGLKTGDTYTVPCWINEVTTVRSN